jgi:tetratricopeptide (TPR) repeat protein
MAPRSGKKGTPETTAVRPADESDPPSEQSTSFGLLGLLQWATRSIAHLVVLALLLIVIFHIGIDTLHRRQIHIDPLIVPKAMEDEGYTSLLAANRVNDEIRRIQKQNEIRAVLPQHEHDSFVLGNDKPSLPDIEIPETNLSLNSAIGFLEDFLRITPPHVRTQLIFASGADWHEGPLPPDVARGGPCPLRDNRGDDTTERVFISVSMTGRESIWIEVTVHSPDEAVKCTAREVLEITNPYVLAMYIDQSEHDSTAVVRLLQEAIKLNPKDAVAYNNWGWALFNRKDYDGAIAKYQQALAVDPKNAVAYNNNWGNALAHKKDYDGAIAKYQQILAVDPKDAAAYNNWGWALFNRKDYDGAIAKYQQALAHDPKDTLAYNNWGWALFNRKDYDGAIAKFQKAIDLDPRNADAYNGWGSALAAKGLALAAKQDYDGAIAAYQQAVKVDPKNAYDYNGWGMALAHKQDYDVAIAKFQKATELDPKNEMFRSNLENARKAESRY